LMKLTTVVTLLCVMELLSRQGEFSLCACFIWDSFLRELAFSGERRGSCRIQG
jgi:hypothetical protein